MRRQVQPHAWTSSPPRRAWTGAPSAASNWATSRRASTPSASCARPWAPTSARSSAAGRARSPAPLPRGPARPGGGRAARRPEAAPAQPAPRREHRRLLAGALLLLAWPAGGAGPVRGPGEEQQRADPGPGPGRLHPVRLARPARPSSACAEPDLVGRHCWSLMHPADLPRSRRCSTPCRPRPTAPAGWTAACATGTAPGAGSPRNSPTSRQPQHPGPGDQRPGDAGPAAPEDPCNILVSRFLGGAALANRTFQVGLVQMSCGPDPDANLREGPGPHRRGRGPRAPRWCACPSCSRPSTSASGRTPPCSTWPSPSPAPPPRRWPRPPAGTGWCWWPPCSSGAPRASTTTPPSLFDADGSLCGLYRKMHIPDDPLYYEKFYFTPGRPGLPRLRHPGRPDRHPGLLGPVVPGRRPAHRPGRGRVICSTPPPSAGTPRRRRSSAPPSTTPGRPSSAATPSPTASTWPR